MIFCSIDSENPCGIINYREKENNWKKFNNDCRDRRCRRLDSIYIAMQLLIPRLGYLNLGETLREGDLIMKLIKKLSHKFSLMITFYFFFFLSNCIIKTLSFITVLSFPTILHSIVSALYYSCVCFDRLLMQSYSTRRFTLRRVEPFVSYC